MLQKSALHYAKRARKRLSIFTSEPIRSTCQCCNKGERKQFFLNAASNETFLNLK